jgi:hypothetical protein
MTFESISRFFGVGPAIIQAQIELAKNPVCAPGRPGLLSAAAKEWLENLIRTRFEERKPITYAAVLDSLQYDREVVLTANTRRHITRHTESVKTMVGQPMEAERVVRTPQFYGGWYSP